MLFMTRPPKAPGPVARADCTRSLVAPIVDGGVGLGHLGQAAGIWGESRASFDTDEDYDRNRIGSAIIAGAFAVSAVHGFMWSGECRRRTALSEQAIRDHLRALAVQHSGSRTGARTGARKGQGHSQPKAPPVKRP